MVMFGLQKRELCDRTEIFRVSLIERRGGNQDLYLGKLSACSSQFRLQYIISQKSVFTATKEILLFSCCVMA